MRIFWTEHADDRLRERYVTRDEVEYALNKAKIILPGKNPGTSKVIVDMPFRRKLGIIFKDRPKKRLIITAYWVE